MDVGKIDSWTRWASGDRGALDGVADFYMNELSHSSTPMRLIHPFICGKVSGSISEALMSRMDMLCDAIDSIPGKAYHSRNHTAKVVMSAMMIGRFMSISQDMMDILVLTAICHDYRYGEFQDNKDDKQFPGTMEEFSILSAMNDGLITPQEYPVINFLNSATVFPSFRSYYRLCKNAYDSIKDKEMANKKFNAMIVCHPYPDFVIPECSSQIDRSNFFMTVMSILSDADLLSSCGMSLALNQQETKQIEVENNISLTNNMRYGFMKSVGPFLTNIEYANFGNVRKEILKYYE